MALFRSNNPALKEDTYDNLVLRDGEQAMTVQGTVNKIMFLLFLLLGGAMFTWDMVMRTDFMEDPSALYPWIIGGAIGGFVVALVTIFKPKWSPFTTPVYAILEGLLLGAISAGMELVYPGIALQAVLLTAGTLFTLLFLYKARIIKVTEKFRTGIMAATGGIALVYLMSFVMGLFGVHVPFIHEAGLMGIGFSLVVVVIAALNLVLDFDFIEKGAAANAPKYMEWYGAFGLLVTLVWLYMEILRLLSKLRKR